MAKSDRQKKEIDKLKMENLELRKKIENLKNVLGIKKEKLIKARENLKNKRELEQEKKIKELKKILKNNPGITKISLAEYLNISRVTLDKYLKLINDI